MPVYVTNTVSQVIVWLFIFWVMNAQALPDDKDQPIKTQADQVEIDDKKGVYLYTGDVQMEQGTLTIWADQITIYSNDQGDITEIVAVGTPARYQQKPELNQDFIYANAKTIKYMTQDEKIELLTKAELEQQGSTFNGERILYDIKRQVVNASGGIAQSINPGDSNKKKGRVELIIQPKKKQ